MKRAYLYPIMLPAVIGLGQGCACAEEEKDNEKRPNILFLLTDDQNFQTIHALGNREIDTPNMDCLVKNGTVFTETHVMGGLNGAISQPSRAMLLTGRGLMDVHRNGSYIPESEKTFPEWFREAGYITFGTGKWHSDKASFNRSFCCGENIFFGGMHNPGKDGKLGHRRPELTHYDSTGVYSNTFRPKMSDNAFSSELFADAAIEFISSRQDGDAPFLAYVAFTSPHDPRNVLPDYGKHYAGSEISLPDNFLPQHPFDNGDLYERDEKLLSLPRNPEEVKQERAYYYSMVNEVDVQIGRVIEALKKTGEYDNTIIVFAADNGLAVGAHGLLGKQNLYEESVKVPLVICGPGLPKHQKRDSYNYLYDIFPTLCDLTGLDIPKTVKGVSLLPALKSNKVRTRDNVLLTYMNLQRAIKKDGYKLILYNVNGERYPQLFNLKKDPYEKTNLYGDPKYKEIQDKLTELLYSEMIAAGDFCDPAKPDWGFPVKITADDIRVVKP